MKRVVIAGGSGYLGRRLARCLAERGDAVCILTRRPRPNNDPGENWREVSWDGRSAGDWMKALEGADVLVNLTGKNVNCRPTRANRDEIMASRVDSVRVLGGALRAVNSPPEVWVQASSLAIYGDAGDRICDESAHVAAAWPANVCTAWEAALGEALLPNTRWVTLRIGFVIGREGGALPVLERLARWGLGGRIGSGRQWISWAHETDIDRVFLRATDDRKMRGVYNATGPEPVTNDELMGALRAVLNRPWSPPVPKPAVHLGAWLVGSDPVIALTGRRCVPKKLSDEGFEFCHRRLDGALRDLYENGNEEKEAGT